MGTLFGLLILLLLINLPVVFALGVTSVAWILTVEKTPLILVVHRMFRGLDSFPLIAMPFFILAGSILDHIGATRRLMKLAESLVGEPKGPEASKSPKRASRWTFALRMPSYSSPSLPRRKMMSPSIRSRS